MTGAPMPPGTDAILPVERCTVEGQHVVFTEAPKPHFVRRQGENLEACCGVDQRDATHTFTGWTLRDDGARHRSGLSAPSCGHCFDRRQAKSPGEPLKHGEIYDRIPLVWQVG